MSSKVLHLDVREDLRAGREPFSRIMQAVASLKPNQDLVLVAPFQPTPLFAVLEQQGFAYTAKATAEGDWEILFTRAPAAGKPDAKTVTAPARTEKACEDIEEIDARGLEPPEPLVRILEAVSRLAPGKSLRALTDRKPMHLYSRLEERGYSGDTKEQPGGGYITYVQPRQ